MTPKDIISCHELILHEFQPNNTPDKTGDFAVIETERLPDMRRCERLPCVKPLIEHPADPEVLAWDYDDG
jgi:hypothetical protein